MEAFIPLIGEYGFPIMITLYLLHRIETKLDTLNTSINNLAASTQNQLATAKKASS